MTDDPNLSLATEFTSFSGVQVSTAAAPTGAYAGTGGTAVTFTPFTFGNGGAILPDANVIPLWSFGFGGRVYSMDATSVSRDFASSGTLVLTGNGLAHITGTGPSYQDTAGTWNITANAAGATFNFSASSVVGVPDGGMTLALLGFALVSVESLRRRMAR